jgi:phage protein D
MAESPKIAGESLVWLSIFSNGTKIADTYGVIAVTVKKKVNKIALARIVLQDGDMPNGDFPISNTDDFKPGVEIKISAGYMEEEETIFQGDCRQAWDQHHTEQCFSPYCRMQGQGGEDDSGKKECQLR